MSGLISIGNLAALDCYVTIEGQNPYEKTYQDKLDVPHLVDDLFSGRKSLNLDKIFIEGSESGQNILSRAPSIPHCPSTLMS